MPRRSARKPVSRKSVKTAKTTRSRISKRKSQNKKRVKTLTIVALFLLSITLIGGLGFYNKLNQLFASADSPSSINIQDQDIYSVLYLNVDDLDSEPLFIKEIKFVFVDKGMKKSISYTVPVETEVDIPGKFGVEPLSKVFALGALNSENNFEGGLSLLKSTLGSVFGYYPDKYLVVDSGLSDSADRFFSSGSLLPKEGPFKTDYTLSEFYQTYKLVSSFTSDQFSQRTFNKDKIDQELKELTFESNISSERLSIAILNGSGYPGVATFGARVIQNMGGRVVFSGNADKIYNESLIVATDPTSDTVKKIVQSFGIETVLKKGEFNVSEGEVNRSDIVLIFGLDRMDQL